MILSLFSFLLLRGLLGIRPAAAFSFTGGAEAILLAIQAFILCGSKCQSLVKPGRTSGLVCLLSRLLPGPQGPAPPLHQLELKGWTCAIRVSPDD